MIELKQSMIQEILRHCRDCLPNEACGLLGGIAGPGYTTVRQIYPMHNLDKKNRHFSMGAREQLSVVADTRKSGWSFLGNFHRHPATPPSPSAKNIRLALDPSPHYRILSLADLGEPSLRGFRIRAGRAEPEGILVLEEDGS